MEKQPEPIATHGENVTYLRKLGMEIDGIFAKQALMELNISNVVLDENQTQEIYQKT